jgi:hypothetical protein
MAPSPPSRPPTFFVVLTAPVLGFFTCICA